MLVALTISHEMMTQFTEGVASSLSGRSAAEARRTGKHKGKHRARFQQKRFRIGDLQRATYEAALASLRESPMLAAVRPGQQKHTIDLHKLSPKNLTELKNDAAQAHEIAKKCMGHVNKHDELLETEEAQFVRAVKADTKALMAEIEQFEHARALEQHAEYMHSFEGLLTRGDITPEALLSMLPDVLTRLEFMVNAGHPGVWTVIKRLKENPSCHNFLEAHAAQKEQVNQLFIRALCREIARFEGGWLSAQPLLAELTALMTTLEQMVNNGTLRLPFADRHLDVEVVLHELPRIRPFRRFLNHNPTKKQQYQRLYVKVVLREMKDTSTKGARFLGELRKLLSDDTQLTKREEPTTTLGELTQQAGRWAGKVETYYNTPERLFTDEFEIAKTDGTIVEEPFDSKALQDLNMQAFYNFTRVALLRPVSQFLGETLDIIEENVDRLIDGSNAHDKENLKQQCSAAIANMDGEELVILLRPLVRR